MAEEKAKKGSRFVTFSIYIPVELLEAIESIARKEERSNSKVAERLIRVGLSKK